LKILPLFHIENIGKGDLDTRLSRLVDSRLRVYDATGATARAMAIKASSDPVIYEQIQFRKSVFREQVENNFRQEFDRMSSSQRGTSLNAIDALTQLDALDRFHVDLQLSFDETRELLIGSIKALLNIAP
jgi:hypothetical protein